LHSCSYNQTIDFIIVTDDQSNNSPKPKNVRIIYHTLEEINGLFSERLGFPVSIQNGYKLCDFKPAYGFLFYDLILGYDFWGHSDIDVIFGNIRNFITNEVLQVSDVISVRPDYITGCFSLFRNCDKVTRLFMQSKDYKRVFSDSRHYGFDETNFYHSDFSSGKRYDEIHSEIESMMHVVKRLENVGYIRPYFDLHIVEGRPGRLNWDKGILMYRNKYEALLYHLVKLKHVYNQKKTLRTMPDTFSITPTRILA